ncbi:CPCC family cysteine-rich protein [Kitasatospora sp. NPDC018058]
MCPICFWEDDSVQFRWPFTPGGANRVSLAEAQGAVGNLRVASETWAR